MNHVFKTAYQHLSPAKAGDSHLQGQQALAWAKAFVWATSNGARECASHDGAGVPEAHGDLLDELADVAS